jgi:hypothetical protein
LHGGDVHGGALNGFGVCRIGFAGAALFPLHYGEIFLPGTLKDSGERDEGGVWAAVNEEENGFFYGFAADFDPLAAQEAVRRRAKARKRAKYSAVFFKDTDFALLTSERCAIGAR